MDKERTRLLKQLEKLARCRVNDAVKLAFHQEERADWIDKLDLTALAAVKRNEKGSVEVQLVDRLAVLKLLTELSAEQEQQQAAEFFQAWEKQAGEQEAP